LLFPDVLQRPKHYLAWRRCAFGCPDLPEWVSG
jgi:hypothetical protein